MFREDMIRSRFLHVYDPRVLIASIHGEDPTCNHNSTNLTRVIYVTHHPTDDQKLVSPPVRKRTYELIGSPHFHPFDSVIYENIFSRSRTILGIAIAS